MNEEDQLQWVMKQVQRKILRDLWNCSSVIALSMNSLHLSGLTNILSLLSNSYILASWPPLLLPLSITPGFINLSSSGSRVRSVDELVFPSIILLSNILVCWLRLESCDSSMNCETFIFCYFPWFSWLTIGLTVLFIQMFSLFADLARIFFTNSSHAYLVRESQYDSCEAEPSSFYQRIGIIVTNLYYPSQNKIRIYVPLPNFSTYWQIAIMFGHQGFLCLNSLIIKGQYKFSKTMYAKAPSLTRCLSGPSNSWQDTYYATRTSKQPLSSNQKKSEEFDSLNAPQQYERLAKMYQKENEQIQLRNSELLETVRELKQKESFLLQEIAVLQLYYRKVLNSKKKQPFKEVQNKQNLNGNQIMSNHRISINSQVQTYNEQAGLPYRESHLRDFNDEFCKLVEQSITQKDSNKRKMLRKELAKLATQMKKVRSEDQEVGVEMKKNKNLYVQTEISTNKTLAPYLQDLSFKNLEKTKLIHSKSGSKLRQLGTAKRG